jgi:hypothetical protein
MKVAAAKFRAAFRWDDRVVDLYPEFQLRDPWVTREFRVFDLLAQLAPVPASVNRPTPDLEGRRDGDTSPKYYVTISGR